MRARRSWPPLQAEARDCAVVVAGHPKHLASAASSASHCYLESYSGLTGRKPRFEDKKVVFHYFSLFFIEFCFEFLLASCFGSSVHVGNPNTCPKLWATPLFAKITASQAPLGHPCTRPLDASGSSWMRRCKAWPSKNPKALFTLTRSDWIRAGQVPLASRCFPRANP